MADVVVREARPADAPAIAAIGRRMVPETHKDIADPEFTRTLVEQTYADGSLELAITRCEAARDAHFLVADRDDTVVGYLHFDCFDAEPELHRIYLDRSEQGHGTGTRLLDELNALVGDRSYILMVVSGNERAIRFYELNGFVEDHRVGGEAYYEKHMGVKFPPDAHEFECVVMRHGG